MVFAPLEWDTQRAMDIRETFNGNVTVLHLHGDLTGAACHQLRQCVDGVLAKRGLAKVPAPLVLVFHDVGMDKGGMYEVLDTRSKCALRLVAPPARPDREPWPEDLTCASEEWAVRSLEAFAARRAMPSTCLHGSVMVLDLHTERFVNGNEVYPLVWKLIHQGHRLFLIDMAPVRLIDSAGIGGVVGAARLAKEYGGALGLFNLSKHYLGLLRITPAMFHFEVYDNEEVGVRALETPDLSPGLRLSP